MKRKDLSFLGCNSRLAWAIIFERLETIILFLINEFAMNQRISFFLRNSIGDSKLVRLMAQIVAVFHNLDHLEGQ